jgi:beta-lactamase regulating signal transducer with metallopeptidase domain
MTLLLSVTFKMAVLLLGALAAMALLRQRSAAIRHWVLAAALFGCLCLPALELSPAWSIPLPGSWSSSSTSSLRLVSEPAASPAIVDVSDVNASVTAGGSGLPSAATLLVSLWIVGAVVGIAVLVAGLWRLRTLAAGSEMISSGPWRSLADEISQRYGVHRHVRLLCGSSPTMVATWGIVNPTILLPAGAQRWSEERVRAVLHHELAHVLRGDWVIAMTATLLRAVYWFNPVLWIAYRRLRHESERASDDLVLNSGISGSEYATHLLDIARESARRRHLWSPAIAIAHHSTLEGRVRAMLAARVNREPLTVFARVTVAAVLAAITVSIGVVTMSGHTEIAVAPDVRLISSGTLPVLDRETEPPVVEPRIVRAATPAAQSPAAGGTIEGVLYDQYGGLLPGASVRLTQVGSGASQNTLTDRSGSFAFRSLAAGDYELVTDLPGFAPVKNVVRAEPGTPVRRHIILPIGTVQETIHVTCASSDLISTRPGAPTASATPGPTGRQAADERFRIEPKIPSTFTGGIGGQIKAPRKLSHANPVCPTGVTAQSTLVRLAGRIGIDGQFSDLHDISADAQPPYVASAMEAARKWIFTPTLLNNAPIEANMTVTVSYSWN